MRSFLDSHHEKGAGFVSALCCGLIVASLALASPAFAAGGGGGGEGEAEAEAEEARAAELAGAVEEPAQAAVLEVAALALAAVEPERAPGAARERALAVEQAAAALERAAVAAGASFARSKTSLGRRFRRTSRPAILAWSGMRSTRSAWSGTAACCPIRT